jgi:hypothetical protein
MVQVVAELTNNGVLTVFVFIKVIEISHRKLLMEIGNLGVIGTDVAEVAGLAYNIDTEFVVSLKMVGEICLKVNNMQVSRVIRESVSTQELTKKP